MYVLHVDVPFVNLSTVNTLSETTVHTNFFVSSFLKTQLARCVNAWFSKPQNHLAYSSMFVLFAP